MLSDPITQPTTGQSIKVNGKKNRAPDQRRQTPTCPDARENCILMSKRAPSLAPPPRAAFATERNGSSADSGALLGPEGLLQSHHRPQAQGQHRRHLPPPTPGNPTPPERGLGGRPAQAPGADRHLDGFVRCGLCMGRVLKWEFSSDLLSSCTPSECRVLTLFLFDLDKTTFSKRLKVFSLKGRKKKRMKKGAKPTWNDQDLGGEALSLFPRQKKKY